MKPKIKRPLPFAFVLDALERASPYTRPMFGCTSVYVGEKIVFILREKEEHAEDNGVWVATTPEHHESLRKDFPSIRSIGLFGPGPTSWQNLPAECDDFEEAALKACALVLRKDPRIGKVPASKRPKAKTSMKPPTKTSTKTSAKARANAKKPRPKPKVSAAKKSAAPARKAKKRAKH